MSETHKAYNVVINGQLQPELFYVDVEKTTEEARMFLSKHYGIPEHLLQIQECFGENKSA